MQKKKFVLQNNQKLGIVFFATVILIAASFAAIVYVTKKTTPTISNSDDQIEVDYKEGGTLSEKFPADFPVYPHAKIVSSWTNEDGESIGISVIWNTQDNLSTTFEYFATELVENGWQMTNQYKTQDTATLSFEKGKYSGFVGISTKDGQTTISVTIGVKR